MSNHRAGARDDGTWAGRERIGHMFDFQTTRRGDPKLAKYLGIAWLALGGLRVVLLVHDWQSSRFSTIGVALVAGYLGLGCFMLSRAGVAPRATLALAIACGVVAVLLVGVGLYSC